MAVAIINTGDPDFTENLHVVVTPFLMPVNDESKIQFWENVVDELSSSCRDHFLR